MQVSFSQLDLPGDCKTSYILIRDGEHSDSPVIGRYCGFHTDVGFFTKSNKMWVEYKTPKNDIGRFVLYWFNMPYGDGRFFTACVIIFFVTLSGKKRGLGLSGKFMHKCIEFRVFPR